LSNVFRKTFDLFATPVVMEFRTDPNPYSKHPRRRGDAARRRPSRRS
jgi:hypothetical protein